MPLPWSDVNTLVHYGQNVRKKKVVHTNRQRLSLSPVSVSSKIIFIIFIFIIYITIFTTFASKCRFSFSHSYEKRFQLTLKMRSELGFTPWQTCLAFLSKSLLSRHWLTILFLYSAISHICGLSACPPVLSNPLIPIRRWILILAWRACCPIR